MFNKNLKIRITELEKRLPEELSNIKDNFSKNIDELSNLIHSLIREVPPELKNHSQEIEAIKVILNEHPATIQKINSDITNLTKSQKEVYDGFYAEFSADLINLWDNTKGANQEVVNNLNILRNDTNKSLAEFKQSLEDTLRHNFTITEALCKENSIEISKLNKEVEITDKRISENDNKSKLYIDGQLGLIKETLEKINSRITDISQELTQKTGSISNDIFSIKEEISALKNVDQKEDNKIELLNREIPGLREALKKNSSDIDKLIVKNDVLLGRTDLLAESINYIIDNNIDKKITEYQKWVNNEYYQIIDKIILYVRSLLVKTATLDNSEIEKLKNELSQKSLEEKWRKEREDKGKQIINKGTQIIEKRRQLHDKIIQIEKSGGNVDKEKEQLKAYDEILGMIKNG